MANKVGRKNTKPARLDQTKARHDKDEGWEERLRLVGDARFTEVAWSGRDHPSWPVPIK